MTEDDFRRHLQSLVDASCGSAGAVARKHKVHPKSLTLFLSGARGASSDLAAAFGFERRYVRATPAPSVSPDPAGEEACTCARRYDPDQFDHQDTCAAVASSPIPKTFPREADIARALLTAANINKPVSVVNLSEFVRGTSQWSEVRTDRPHNGQVAHCADQEDADLIAHLINAALLQEDRQS